MSNEPYQRKNEAHVYLNANSGSTQSFISRDADGISANISVPPIDFSDPVRTGTGGASDGVITGVSYVGTTLTITSSIGGPFTTTIPGGSGNPVVSGAVVGNDMILTLSDTSTVTIPVGVFYDDTNLGQITSGVLAPATGIATFTRDDASTFTVDFSALLQVIAATAISPASTDATGAVGTATDYARGDHKHPAQGASSDADNLIALGADGLHRFEAAADAISADAGNTLTKGTDGKLQVPAGATSFADALLASTDGTGAGGVATSAARSDHKHIAQGVSADANNATIAGTDGLHQTPLSTTIPPAATDLTGAVGTGTTLARADHQHIAQAKSSDANNFLEDGTDGRGLITVDPSGWTGNLSAATGASTLQAVLDAVDAFSAGGGGFSQSAGSEAVGESITISTNGFTGLPVAQTAETIVTNTGCVIGISGNEVTFTKAGTGFTGGNPVFCIVTGPSSSDNTGIVTITDGFKLVGVAATSYGAANGDDLTLTFY